MMTRRLLSAALLSFALITRAEAGLSAPATICTPSTGSPAMLGLVKFPGTTTGTIRVNCPIDTDYLTAASKARFTYRDSTGTGTSAHVKVFLRVTSPLTGTSEKFLILNSDEKAKTTVNFVLGKPLTGLIDVSENYYALEVELTRSTSAELVEFYGYAVSKQ